MKVLTAGDQSFNEGQQKFLNKLAIVVGLRAKAAQDLFGEYDSDLSLEQMRLLLPVLKELCSAPTVPAFPIDTASLRKQLNQISFAPAYVSPHMYFSYHSTSKPQAKKAVVIAEGASDDEEGEGSDGPGVKSAGL
jgi:hypothetical protein